MGFVINQDDVAMIGLIMSGRAFIRREARGTVRFYASKTRRLQVAHRG
jgi:hypothetical protein